MLRMNVLLNPTRFEIEMFSRIIQKNLICSFDPPIRSMHYLGTSMIASTAFNSRVFYWKSFDKCTFCLYLIFNVDLQNFMVFTLFVFALMFVFTFTFVHPCHMSHDLYDSQSLKVLFDHVIVRSHDICNQPDYLIKHKLSSKVA